MPNFIEDLVTTASLPVKVDKTPLPGGANPDQYMTAADWATLRAALVDLRVPKRVWLGDGSDGAGGLDGITTVAGMVPSSNVYTATRDLFFDTLTLGVGITLLSNGWRVFVLRTLTLTGNAKIACNGGDAVGITAGASPITGAVYLGVPAGSSAAGGAGSPTPGTAPAIGGASASAPRGYVAGTAAAGTGGASGANGNPGTAGAAGQGGGGGGSGGGNSAAGAAGAAGGTVTLHASAVGDIRAGDSGLIGVPPKSGTGWSFGAGGGGGRGGYDTTGPWNTQGAGGGGGAGGGYVVVCAREITGTGTLEAKGGNGGNGQAGHMGGGGGGGGGGLVVVGVVAGGFPTCVVTGGTGGTGGTGTGASGGNGGNGGAGLVIQLRL